MCCPNTYFFNRSIAIPPYIERHGRAPKDPDDPGATINDYIFDKMARNNWSELQRRCVDKELCKAEFAQLAPEALCAKTIDVIDCHRRLPFPEFAQLISKHFNTKTVAKPTSGSGNVLFLKTQPIEARLLSLYRDARHNFFFAHRESQYATLRKKVIVEEDLSSGQALTDYKLFCSRGHAFMCQVDAERFSNHTKTYLTLPDFRIVDETWGFVGRSDHVDRLASLERMISLAEQLSRDFEFVRVDLYDTPRGIFVGELTFTPGCSLEVLSSDAFGIEMLRNIRR
jgi:hypothetical protein